MGWKSFGLSAEIAAMVCESKETFTALKAPIARLALPDAPAPASAVLEKAYYPDTQDIIDAVKNL